MDTETLSDFQKFTSIYGDAALVKKMGKNWVVEFRGHGFSNVFRTRIAAMEKARAWRQMVRLQVAQAA